MSRNLGRRVARLFSIGAVPAILAAGLSTILATPAFANSPGCAAVNSGLLDYSGTTVLSGVTRTVAGTFYTNEVLTMTLASNSLAAVSNLKTDGTLRLSTDLRIGVADAGTSTARLTITGPGVSQVSSNLIAVASAATLTVRCSGVIAPTTTTVAVHTTPTLVGQPASFTATVETPAGSAQVPTGNVAFTLGGTTYPATALSNGTATFTTSALPAGNFSVSAAYAGNSSFAASTGTSSTRQTVNRANTTTRVDAPANPVFGQMTTFTATIAPVAPGGGAPDGNVVFTIGGTDQAPVPLSGGTVSITRADIPAGNVAVSARYGGSINYNASSGSITGGLTINQAPTTTSLSLDPAVIEYGQSARAIARVVPASGVAAGTIIFSVDGVDRPAVSLADGAATLVLDGLSAGQHPIGARFAGSINHTSSIASVVQLTVSQAPTSLSLTADVANLVFGDNLRLTVLVGSSFEVPSGDVVFTVGEEDYSATLSNGTASIAIANLTVGTHRVEARYVPASGFEAATAVLPGGVTVIAAPVDLMITPPSGAITVGKPASFAISVTSQAGIVGGEVVLVVDGIEQPPVRLDGGAADLTFTFETAGAHTVAVRYLGNESFAANLAGAPGSASLELVVLAPAEILVVDTALPQAVVGVPYQGGLSVSGGAEPYDFLLVGGTLPEGMAFDPASGTLSGTPLKDGAFPLVIEIADANGERITQRLTLSVAAPTITLAADYPPGTAGEPYSGTMSVAGGASPFTFSLQGSLPDFMSFDPETGTLTGTPTTPGRFPLTITISDANGFEQSITVTLDIAAPSPVGLVFSDIDLQAGFGEPYEARISISGGTAPYVFAVVGGQLPPGIVLIDGVLSGSPTQPGSYAFTLAAEDSAGNVGERAFTLDVPVPAFEPAMPTSLPQATGGVAYDASLAISGTAPLSYSVTAGNLPSGLTLDPSTGHIAGTPLQAGDFVIEVTVTNGFGQTALIQLTLTVIAPQLTAAAALPRATGGVEYTMTLQVSGGTAPYTFKSAGILPPGLSFDEATGTIKGTPTAAGSYELAVTVRDANGFAAEIVYALTVVAPAIGIDGEAPALRVGLPVDFTPIIAGGTAPYAVRMLAGNLPDGLVQDPVTGRIWGMPTAQGRTSFTMEVTDALGFTATRTMAWDVASNIGTATLPGSLPAAQAGVAYTGSVMASGGAAPLSYALSAGTLPPELALDPTTGAITGKPLAAGASVFTVTVTDAEGRINAQSYTFSIAPPVLAIGSHFSDAQINQPYTEFITVTGGVEPYRFSLDNAPHDLTIDPVTGAISGVPKRSGTFEVIVSVTDGAGSTEIHTARLVVNAVPIVLILANPGSDLMSGTEYVSSVAALNAIGAVTYAVESGELPDGLVLDPATGEIRGVPASQGSSQFSIRAIDADGNTGLGTYTLTAASPPLEDAPVDLSVSVGPPAAVSGEPVTIEVSITSALGNATGGTAMLIEEAGGTTLQSVLVDASGRATFIFIAYGSRTYRVNYSGAPGYAAGTSGPFTIDAAPLETKTTLTVAPSDPAPGATVELTATVERAPSGSGPAPAGSVIFLLDGEEIATAALVDGVATARISPPAGVSQISARFEPSDASLLPSEDSYELTVAGNATIALSGPQGEVPAGSSLSYTVTVSPAGTGPAPSGRIFVRVDGAEREEQPLEGSTATFTVDLPPGAHDISFVYSGDDVYPEVGPTSVTVTVAQALPEPRNTSTVLSPSASTSVVGDMVVLTARVGGQHSITPTGIVRFFDETTGTGIGTVSLDNDGEARLIHAFRHADSRMVVARYGGDEFNMPSTDQLVFNIVPSPTQISLSTDAEVVGPGQTTSLTATFSRAPEGRGQPNIEEIQFLADDEVFATRSVNGNTAVSVESALIDEDTEFTAVLIPSVSAGTDLLSVSNAVVVTVAVGLSPSLTDLTVSPALAQQGDPVILTATVSDPSDGATPAGSVRFARDGVELATVSLVGGVASISRSDLPIGTAAITAEYLGSSSHDRSDDAKTATVTPLPGTAQLTLTGTASPSVIFGAGQTITLAFEVGAAGVSVTDIVLTADGATVICPQDRLASGATMVCTAPYVATLADAASDTIAISATVTGAGASSASTTISLGSQVDDVLQTFEGLTEQYMSARARMVTGISLPNIFDRRMALSGGRPGTLDAEANNTSQTLHVASSLEHIRGYTRHEGDAGPRRQLEPSPFNAWFDARLALHASGEDSSTWSRLAVAAGGVDYLLNDWLLVGIVAQVDSISDRRNDSEASGTGYLAGPYVSLAPSKNVSLDGALMVGGSSNQAQASMGGVAYSGDFNTMRLLATAGLKGFLEWEDYVLRPSAAFFLSSEQSSEYCVTDATGAAVTVPSQELMDLQLRGGLTLERAFELENGARLTPMVGLNLTHGGTLSDGAVDNRATGTLMGGLLYDAGDFSTKSSIEAEFGTNGFASATGRLSVSGKF